MSEIDRWKRMRLRARIGRDHVCWRGLEIPPPSEPSSCFCFFTDTWTQWWTIRRHIFWLIQRLNTEPHSWGSSWILLEAIFQALYPDKIWISTSLIGADITALKRVLLKWRVRRIWHITHLSYVHHDKEFWGDEAVKPTIQGSPFQEMILNKFSRAFQNLFTILPHTCTFALSRHNGGCVVHTTYTHYPNNRASSSIPTGKFWKCSSLESSIQMGVTLISISLLSVSSSHGNYVLTIF